MSNQKSRNRKQTREARALAERLGVSYQHALQIVRGEMRMPTHGYMKLGSQAKAVSKPPQPIMAQTHTDDYAFEIEFDALPYFKAASDTELRQLAECGFGGDYPADQVAEFFVDSHEKIKHMFDYIHASQHGIHPTGFECHVDQDQAEAWILANRPELAAELEIEEMPWQPLQHMGRVTREASGNVEKTSSFADAMSTPAITADSHRKVIEAGKRDCEICRGMGIHPVIAHGDRTCPPCKGTGKVTDEDAQEQLEIAEDIARADGDAEAYYAEDVEPKCVYAVMWGETHELTVRELMESDIAGSEWSWITLGEIVRYGHGIDTDQEEWSGDSAEVLRQMRAYWETLSGERRELLQFEPPADEDLADAS